MLCLSDYSPHTPSSGAQGTMKYRDQTRVLSSDCLFLPLPLQ